MSIWGATPATVWEFHSARWSSGTRSRNSAGTARRPSRRRRSFSGRATARSISASAPSTSTRSDANNPAFASSFIPNAVSRWRKLPTRSALPKASSRPLWLDALDRNGRWAPKFHLVNRLGKELRDRKVIPLDPSVCVCTTMFRITPQHLLWALENLGEGKIVNQISVDEQTRHYAKAALDRMLSLHER